MDIQDRKMLTEWLGECWHDTFVRNVGHDNVETICPKCFKSTGELPDVVYRVFTYADDMVALEDRLEKEGLWRSFFWWSWKQKSQFTWACDHTSWLIKNPERFCQLCADFLRLNR